MRITSVFATALAALLAGCAVGPNFKKPAPPEVSGYATTPLSTTSSSTNVVGGQPQKFVEGLDIPAEWWKLFHSKPLNDLIERSLTNNPSLKAAQAALTVAHENVLAQKGLFFPSIDGGFSASRHQTPNLVNPFVTQSTPEGYAYYSYYTPQVAVSYAPDVFGLNRRTVESLKAQQEQQRFALIATHITLSANVVEAAILEASLRAQIEATHELTTINTNMLQTLRRQFEKGYIGRLDVAAQESQLLQVSATLPPLLKQLDQQRDLLTALAGAFPDRDLPETFELSKLELPEELPVSLPSKLVEQRPDVRQAEENLHSASAQIGVAVANRLPNITLTADAGSLAVEASKMFAAGTGFWDLGANVTQPLFHGFTLMHQERAARAAYVQAAEQYRSTVLTAFQNVADTLKALKHDADALKTAAAAKDVAGATLEMSRKQFEAGYAGYLALLNAEQTYQQAVINLVQAQANRYADTAALFQALGGGWWNRADVARQ